MSLRQQVMRGGAYLAGRQALGLVMSFGGVLLTTRLIGATGYGLYIAAVGIVSFLGIVGNLGVDAYLVRREQELEDAACHQAFSLLLASGLTLMLLGYLVTPLLQLWFGDPRFLPPLLVLLPTLPIALPRLAAIARLEHDLNFRAISVIETVSLLSFYGVALGLALADGGVWALVGGYWTMQIMSVVQCFTIARYRPRLLWSPSILRDMLGYGLGYSLSTWVWQTRTLVNPLVVSRYLGPEGAGYVAIAIRLVESLGFVKRVTYRLSIAAFAKIQNDHVRLRRALEEAMAMQVLVVGPLFACFATVASLVLPQLFGREWGPVLEVFPLIALGYLANAVFNMHSAVLYVLRQNRNMLLVNAVHISLFAGGALILVPRIGLMGYGLAEVLGLGSYAVIHTRVRRLFPFTYARAVPWFLGFAIPLLGVYLPIPWRALLWLPLLLLILLVPQQRRQIGEYRGYFRWRTA